MEISSSRCPPGRAEGALPSGEYCTRWFFSRAAAAIFAKREGTLKKAGLG